MSPRGGAAHGHLHEAAVMQEGIVEKGCAQYMAWFRSQDDPLMRRSREEERYRQGVIRVVRPCASNLLRGHADPLNRRLVNLHALDPLQSFLSRRCARPLTKARMAAWAERLGRARIFQI